MPNAYIDSFIAIAKTGNVEALKNSLNNDILSRADLNIDSVNEDGENALYCAAENNHFAAVKFLLENGSNHNIEAAFNQSCIHGNLQMAQLLLEQRGEGRDLVNNNCGENDWKPIHFIAKNKHAEMIDFLIDNGAEINVVTSKENSALMIAIQNEAAEFARNILSYEVDVKIANTQGATALHYAAEKEGFAEIITILVVKGADVNATAPNNGWTPLHCAALKNNYKNVEQLILQNADVILKNAAGQKALDLAKDKEVKTLLSSQEQTNFSIRGASASKLSANQLQKSGLK